MSTYNGKIKVVKARPRSKRLRDIGGTVSTVTSSREVAAAPSVDLSRYMIKETFDELFEKVNLGTDAAPKWAIKAKYNFYTVGWLSFRGANDGSGGSAVAGAANLSDLKDVSLGSLAAGQALVWNGAKWVNSTIATSGLDESSLSNYLSSHGYATQQWVTAQGFLKQHQSLADYLKIDGSNGTAAGVTALIKHLDDATADILDTTKLVTSDTLGDNAASRMYHRRPATALWNYIKSKSDALYVTVIGTSGNNLTYIKGGITNNITVPYAAKTRLLEEAYGLARGSYDALQERPDELPAGLRVKFKGYPGAGVGPESYWNTVLDITAVSGGSVTGAGYRTQFLFSNSLNESDGTFWVRNGIDATWNSWQQVFTTGNYQGLLANTFYNKTEVNAKLDKKLDKATFDDLFEKVNLGTDAAPKWAIKAKYNFYTVGWLSFRGANDGSGGSAVAGAANLSDLKDVSLGSLAAGQALVWNGAKWVNSTIATSGLDEASLANYLSSHGYATQAWANGAFVNKAGDTMTGHLTMLAKDVYLKNSTDNSQYVCYGFKNTANAIIAQVGYHNTAKRIVINPVGSSEPWVDAVGKYNLIVGNNELKYNTYTLWHSGNDGHNSGLDADLLDGVHNGEVTARLVNYNNGGNVSGAVQFMQRANGWNAWDAPTQNWYSVIKLNHGNGDTYYSRVLAFDFHSDNIYTHRKHNGTDYGWHTLAFIDSTVANANSLGGIAAGDYVTRNGDQKIGGVKTFTTYVKNEMASMFKAGSDGIYFAPSTDGSLRINTHTNYSYTGYIGRISQDGSLAMGSFIKSGGTASQFLKADGSVDGTSYATASALSTGLAGKVSKSGDTMSGDLRFGAPDKGVRFNHAGVNGIWGHTSDNAATNQIGSTALSNLVIASHWGVAFTSTCSNQTYTDKVAVGIDTRIGSVAAGSWVKASHFLANTTRLCTNLNADLLDSYHVSQLARLTSANASAGAHNLPVYVNGGVVNAVSSVGEAFLSWGGQSLNGGFSPVDGAMVGALGANRFAFIKPAGTTFQYSTNSGSTWNNYNLSDTQKSGFFDAGVQQALYASGASNVVGTASHQLRIIIATSAACIYTAINKFVINFSTQGCHGTTVTIEKALESTPGNWVTVASNVPLSGWSGWNVVNVPAFLTYGNSPGVQYGRIRFTFKCTSVGSNNSPFAVYCIMAYGGFGWMTASSMAANGHLYSYDGNQNAYFPGCVRLNNDGQYPGTTWNNGAGQLGIALVNNSNQTPLLVAHRYGAASDVTGTNRLFALELLNSGAEMHFAFGGSTKFSMTNTGVFFANGGLWTNGFLSFKGKNTSSDARLKRYIGDIRVPLAVIAKAPNIIYAWRDDGSLDMGSIAQYWQRYLPLSVRLCQNGYLGMDYSKVALACVISMASELLGVKDDVSVLKQEVRQLRHENRELKQQIDKMGRRIA
ncbi:hypothetical protein [uncultured Muribaculum sp.]|jgi:hypothetical protein|uniref:tail fiber domain-containing protein n=1 Tax=uncultured Muribaculum sp. TaxID=1918613 RepID=UPI0025B017B3|nr:hypothetical protein [uncultured Muribaculum sp.]